MIGRGQEWLYVAVDANGIFKIGCSADPKMRRPCLGHELKRPFKLVRTWHRPLQDAMRIEFMCHAMLKPYRAEAKYRETYKVSLRKIVETVRVACEMAAQDDFSVLKKGTASGWRR